MIILDIISPERTLVHESVLSVELPGTLGRFEVLKDHAPLISSLVEGNIVYKIDGDKDGRITISSGFVEVCDNHVTACVEL
ncbi:MAG: F0F1 ATP synthase subunit epsilon [Bacteroidales bacterium]|nr:F0F1 ATP synthase subunit epsilon [Bacteroidales bacterium]